MSHRPSWTNILLHHPFEIVRLKKDTCYALATVQKLPTELIHLIYGYLGPRDFDSARRTCPGWMQASIDLSLLQRALKGAGWLQEYEYAMDCIRQQCSSPVSDDRCLALTVMSNILALIESWNVPRQSLLEGNPPVLEHGLYSTVGNVDFTNLSRGYYADPTRVCPIIFRVSVCQNFVLVAHASTISVYELDDCRVRILTTILCPRRVIDMCMDGTCLLYRVAVLLEGRIGMVCDLDSRKWRSKKDPNSDPPNQVRKGLAASQRADGFESQQDQTPQTQWTSPLESIMVYGDRVDPVLQNLYNHHHYSTHHIAPNWNADFGRGPFGPGIPERDRPVHHENTSVPTETGSRTVFLHLCSPSDPPKSVGICSHRCCVAFGSNHGIELHWPEGVDGEHLFRNVQLRVPTDFVHFVPSHAGYPRARGSIRLVPSQAHPDDSTTAERQNPGVLAEFRTALASLGVRSAFYPDLPVERSTAPVDHYHVLPLADGVHMLFTDASNSQLCLGTYGDHDHAGHPRRLSRKFIFVPPDGSGQLPRIYATTRNIRAGIKVAAVYGNDIVQYSIPPDILGYSLREETSGLSETDRCRQTLDCWRLLYGQSGMDQQGLSDPWPLHVYGVRVAAMDHIVDLAIQNDVSLCIWAFARDGMASAWVFNPLQQPFPTFRRSVSPDGNVVDGYSVDWDGDVIMEDAEDTDCARADR